MGHKKLKDELILVLHCTRQSIGLFFCQQMWKESNL